MSQSYNAEVIPDTNNTGQRIDNYLLTKTKLPRSLVYKALRQGQIRVNTKKVEPSYKLQENDILRIPKHYLNAPTLDRPAPKDTQWIEQFIVYSDDNFFVLNKPNGLAVHGGSGESFGMIELLRHHYNNNKLELVHRLDKDTSGLTLVAKKRTALVELSSLFANRTIQKTYLALLKGSCKRKVTVEKSLRIDRLQGIRKATIASDGQSAETTFAPIAKKEQLTLCAVYPKTGRMHQIRAHALYLRTPIIGDKIYGTEDGTKLHLHAAKLEFNFSGKHFIFEQSPPSFWDQSLFEGWDLWKTIKQHQP